MIQADPTPELTPADRHAVAQIIVEQDGVTYEEALAQIEALTRDLDDPSSVAAAPVDPRQENSALSTT